MGQPRDPEPGVTGARAAELLLHREFHRSRAGESLAHVEGEWICISRRGERTRVLPVAEVHLRGRHNLANAVAACAIGSAAGFSDEVMALAIGAFRGVPHRLEFVGRLEGVDWYNDFIATAPERAIAAMKSFDEPILLLAGGRDKKLPWDEWAQVVRARVEHLILFGEAAPLIRRALGEAPAELAAAHRFGLCRVGLGRGSRGAPGQARAGRRAGARRHKLRSVSRFRRTRRALPIVGARSAGKGEPMTKLFRERMRGADLGFDHIMLLLVLALIILGLMTVASSSWGASYSLSPTHSVWYLFSRQLVWALIGLVLMAITFRIDYHRWQRWALPVGLLTVVMLIAVVVVNWDSPVRRGLFNDSVQASEVAKFATVIYLGVWLVSKSDVLDNLSLGIVPYAVLIGAFAGLILMEPDISAAATVVILGMAMFFLGGGGYRNVALATVVMGAGVWSWRWSSDPRASRNTLQGGEIYERPTCTSSRPCRPSRAAG